GDLRELRRQLRGGLVTQESQTPGRPAKGGQRRPHQQRRNALRPPVHEGLQRLQEGAHAQPPFPPVLELRSSQLSRQRAHRMMPMVYLDHSATTPLDPEVLQAMMPYLTEEFGNASSVYGLGQRARQAIDQARDEVAAFYGVEAREVIFTSGGTEGDNFALRG